jgi:hypothetical protein
LWSRTLLRDAGVRLRMRQRSVTECESRLLAGLWMDGMAGELRETGIAVMPDRERQG